VSHRSRVDAVGVVVPARDEQDNVLQCLRSIRHSLAALPAGTRTAVTVVLDRCTDATPELVMSELSGWSGAAAVRVAAVGGRRAGSALHPEPAHIVAGSGVGAVRDLGVRLTLRRLRRHRPGRIWLLNTDADTTVPEDWAPAHLHAARAGADGVAGMADLRDPTLSAAAMRHYRDVIAAGLVGSGHRHVYGANLGVRADAYLAVGGFPTDGVGEDHGLWVRLHAAGYGLVSPAALRVTTSARLHGRAEGGLADLLRSLQAGRPTDPAEPSLDSTCGTGAPAG
jgi:hypothetical protein